MRFRPRDRFSAGFRPFRAGSAAHFAAHDIRVALRLAETARQVRRSRNAGR